MGCLFLAYDKHNLDECPIHMYVELCVRIEFVIVISGDGAAHGYLILANAEQTRNDSLGAKCQSEVAWLSREYQQALA